MSILKFGRSVPLVELFETFLIVGLVLIAVCSSVYYSFNTTARMMKNEGALPSTVSIAQNAATSQAIWIGIGVIIFFLGIIFYYIHRRLGS